MPASDRKQYIDTLLTIRSGSAGTGIQTRYNELIRHHRVNFNAGIHGDAFLNWHRWYILELENILREVTPCITVPFWAWEMDASNPNRWSNNYPMWGSNDYKLGSIQHVEGCVPDSPFGPGFTMTNGVSCLRRRQGDNFGANDDLADIQTLLNSFSSPSQFSIFSRRMFSVHGTVHCNVGGSFCDHDSAEHPEFFMHHANVDRIWSKWQEKGAAFVTAFAPTGFNNPMPSASGKTPADFADLNNQAGGTCVQYEGLVGGLRRSLLGNAHHDYNIVSNMVEDLPSDLNFWRSLSHTNELSADGLREFVMNNLNASHFSVEERVEIAEDEVLLSGREAYIQNRTVDTFYDPQSETSLGCAAFTRIAGVTCASVQETLQSNPDWSSNLQAFQDTLGDLDHYVTPGATLMSGGVCHKDEGHHHVILEECAHTPESCDRLCKSQDGCVAFTIDVNSNNGCCMTYAATPTVDTILDNDCCECYIMDAHVDEISTTSHAVPTTDSPCVVSLGSDSTPVDGSFEALRSVASTTHNTNSNVNGAGWHNRINTADSFLAPINTALWNVPESPDGGVFAGAGAGLNDAGNEYQESFYTDVENLEIGKEYTIQFWQACAADKLGRSADENQAAWEVHFGSSMQMAPTLTYQDNDLPSTWSQVSVTFTASATTERLEFISKSINVAGGPHGWMNYILVDGITVLSTQVDCQTPTTDCSANSFLDFVQAELQGLCMAKQHGFLEHSLGSFAGCISEISTWLDGNCATGDCSTCVQGFQAAGGCACLADSNCDLESKIPPNCNQCALPATQSCGSGCTTDAPSEISISNQGRDNGVYTLSAYDVMPGKTAYKHFRTMSYLNCCEATGKWGLTKYGFTACEADFTYWLLETASCSVCDLVEAVNEVSETTQLPQTTAPTGCDIAVPTDVSITNQGRDNGVYALREYDVMPGKVAFKHFRTESYLNCCENTGKWGLTKYGFTACDADYTYWLLDTTGCSVCDLVDGLNAAQHTTTVEVVQTSTPAVASQTPLPGCTLTAPSEVTISNQWRSDNGVYTLQAYDVMPGKPAFKHFRTQSFLNCCESTGKWGLTKYGYTACDADYTYWHLETASCSVCDLMDAVNGVNLPTTQEPEPTFTRSQVGQTCRPEHQSSGSYCALPSRAVKLSSAEECLSKCEAWEECVCGVAHSWKSGEYLCHLFTDSNDPPSALTCKTVLREDAFAGAYKPYGKLTCGDEFNFGQATHEFTESTRRNKWKSNKSDCSRDKVIELQLNARGMTRSDFTARHEQLASNLASSLGVKSDQVKLSLEPSKKRRVLNAENNLVIYARIEATAEEAEAIRSKTQNPTLKVEGMEFEVVQMDVQPLTDDVVSDAQTTESSGIAVEIFVVVALCCLLVGLFGGFGFHRVCFTQNEKVRFEDDPELPTFKGSGSSNVNATKRASVELQKSWQGESLKM
jgi:tyrosinase